MSQSVDSNEVTRPAGADLSTKKYYIVKQEADGDFVLASAATDSIAGVLQNKPGSGEAALVRFGGTSKVIAGGTVAVGDWLTTDANGKAVATTVDGDLTIGRAMTAGVANDIVEVQVSIQHLYIA